MRQSLRPLAVLVAVLALALLAAPALAAPAPPTQEGVSIFVGPNVDADTRRNITQRLVRGISPEQLGLSRATGRAASPPRSVADLRQRALRSRATYRVDAQASADALTAAAYDPITYEECWANGDKSGTVTGWIKHRFAFCRINTFYYQRWRINSNGTTTIVGHMTWNQTELGTGSNGQRAVTFQYRLDNFIVHLGSSSILDITLVLHTECLDSTGTPSAACQTQDLGTTRRPRLWRTNGWSTPQTFTSDPATGVGIEQLTPASFRPRYYATDSWWRGTATWTGDSQDLRFDSADYIRNPDRPGGGLFPRTTPHIVYHLTGQGVDAVARHIDDAQHRPELTFPQFPGKTVPGELGGEPLSRLYWDTQRQDANHAAAVATCNESFPGQYPAPDIDCDEYPFRSTYEGAALGNNRYSARPLDSSQNRAAGGFLVGFYNNDRILDADLFWVKIEP